MPEHPAHYQNVQTCHKRINKTVTSACRDKFRFIVPHYMTNTAKPAGLSAVS